MKKISLLLLLMMTLNSYGYDILERTRLIEDRLKLQEDLKPLGHDFLLDINAYFSGDTMDLASDVQDVAGSTDSTTAASSLLDTWNNRELSFRGVINLGIPLFTMKFGGVKIVPELMRVQAAATVNAAITEELLDSLEDIASLLPESVPEELRNAIGSTPLSVFDDGDDIVRTVVEENGLSIPGVEQYYGLYTVPDNFGAGIAIPNVNFYAKVDVKAGPKVAWYGKNFFGHVSLYGLGRADIQTRLTSDILTNDGTEISYPTGIETWDVVADASIGYSQDNYKVQATVEEFDMFNLSEEDFADVDYGDPMLFKIQAEYEFKPFGFLKARPYGGFHLRDGYGVSDGYYIGADFGAYVWGDRLGINVRAQLDPEHITIAPQLRFWLLQIDGMIKTPISDDVDGVEVGSIFGLNLRLFI